MSIQINCADRQLHQHIVGEPHSSYPAYPLVIGGDHSVHIPCIRAFDDQEPIHIIHIDAHLDFVDERHDVRYGHGNP